MRGDALSSSIPARTVAASIIGGATATGLVLGVGLGQSAHHLLAAVGLAALIARGVVAVPLVAAGLLSLALSGGAGLPAGVSSSAVTVVGWLLVATRLRGVGLDRCRPREVAWFAAGALISAVIGTGTLVITGADPDIGWGSIVPASAAIVAMTPGLLLLWWEPRPGHSPGRLALQPRIVATGGVPALAMAAGMEAIPVALSSLVPLIWAAHRRGLASASLISLMAGSAALAFEVDALTLSGVGLLALVGLAVGARGSGELIPPATLVPEPIPTEAADPAPTHPEGASGGSKPLTTNRVPRPPTPTRPAPGAEVLDGLTLVHQPVVELDSGRIVGVESLARWFDGDRLCGPEQFVGELERAGLAKRLGERVLTQAALDGARWVRRSPGLSLAVNVSATEISDPTFPGRTMRICRRVGFPLGNLQLEITESLLVDDLDGAARNLERLSTAGVSIAIDDFGVGWCSLRYLREMPVDLVKIDRSFTSGLSSDERDESIVTFVVELARRLGLGLVIEGVETDEQRRRALDLGCVKAQGFLFGQPRSAAEIDRLLALGPSTRLPGR